MGIIIGADEKSNLWLGAILVPRQAASPEDHIISAAFENVAPEGDVKTTASRGVRVTLVKLD